MLKEVFDAIKTNAKPEQIEANGLQYVLQGDSYVLADNPDVVEAKNKLYIERNEIQNKLDIASMEHEIEELRLRTEREELSHQHKKPLDTLMFELDHAKLSAKVDSIDLVKEYTNINAQIEVEQIKNQLTDLTPARKEHFGSLIPFIQFIQHESNKSNKTGKDYFIMLNAKGGKFYTNFERIKDAFYYERQFSEVYKRLKVASSSRTVDQKELLEFLLENKHYIAEFPTVFNSFKKVKNTTTSKFETEPMLTDSNEEVFEVVQTWNFNGEVKKEKITLIPEIELTIPVINMGEVKYEMEMYITPIKGREGQIMFDLYAPGLEYVLQKALNDELEYTKEQLKDLTEAYIGLDI